VIEYLRPIQKEQVVKLEQMVGCRFPEWVTLHGNETPSRRG
jgi:hypothetical protein